MIELRNKTYTINIGTDKFKELATGTDLFVDKTSFISALLGGGYKVTLITRPRRWGKTLNMSMLQYFFFYPC
ncbi:MAG: AAA family ATPase [Proteobacteria bacterium]|nr:AAA family ATPase [Pseudomonadota bacterium]